MEARLQAKSDLPGQNRLVEVTLRPTGPLLPGAAEVRYPEVLAEGLLLPAGAVRTEDGEAFVYVVEEGRARKRPVRLLAQEGGRAAVAGLEAGEAVVYPVPEGLEDGDPVEVVP